MVFLLVHKLYYIEWKAFLWKIGEMGSSNRVDTKDLKSQILYNSQLTEWGKQTWKDVSAEGEVCEMSLKECCWLTEQINGEKTAPSSKAVFYHVVGAWTFVHFSLLLQYEFFLV